MFQALQKYEMSIIEEELKVKSTNRKVDDIWLKLKSRIYLFETG